MDQDPDRSPTLRRTGQHSAQQEQAKEATAAAVAPPFANHGPTTCRPCSFFFAEACANSAACAFCHEHLRTRRVRLCKPGGIGWRSSCGAWRC
mmetsp:Transcript_122011/g.350568  ORF Transcript_122011/g.350568 Transcript_122011/m.350568 type:complete len:93 (-) Transcript_122011:328-606(-)